MPYTLDPLGSYHRAHSQTIFSDTLSDPGTWYSYTGLSEGTPGGWNPLYDMQTYAHSLPRHGRVGLAMGSDGRYRATLRNPTIAAGSQWSVEYVTSFAAKSTYNNGGSVWARTQIGGGGYLWAWTIAHHPLDDTTSATQGKLRPEFWNISEGLIQTYTENSRVQTSANGVHHVCLTWDGNATTNAMKLYVDGTLTYTCTTKSTMGEIYANNISVGQDGDGFGGLGPGTASHLCISSGVLSTTEIARRRDLAFIHSGGSLMRWNDSGKVWVPVQWVYGSSGWRHPQAQQVPHGMVASGGTESRLYGYVYQMFTSSSGTLTVTKPGFCDFLVVGGGGGGGTGAAQDGGGGGGGGGVVMGSTWLAPGTYSVTVGSGGSPGSIGGVGGTGGTTTLTGVASAAGGGGGGYGNVVNGGNGASGGGCATGATAGTGVNGRGHNGNNGLTLGYGSGGGGGAGAAGGQGGWAYGGSGGAGLNWILPGFNYGGGGGGGGTNGGGGATTYGGANGGGTNQGGGNGTAATGGGAGGGGIGGGNYGGGTGGTGVVLVRYQEYPDEQQWPTSAATMP